MDRTLDAIKNYVDVYGGVIVLAGSRYDYEKLRLMVCKKTQVYKISSFNHDSFKGKKFPIVGVNNSILKLGNDINLDVMAHNSRVFTMRDKK